MVTIFQPHRYSRTKALFEDFLTAFYQSDVLIITDIYAASEDPIPGVDAADLVGGIMEHGHKDVMHVSGDDAIVDHLMKIVKEDDMVITLGAGNVWQIGERFIEKFKG